MTRKCSEARQYLADGADMLQLLIPKAQQAKLQVDPDSLAAEVGPETQQRLPGLVAELRRRGSFFESRPEETVNIADFIPPTMSEDEALAKAKLLYG